MQFPDMTVEDLVARRRELLTDLTTEYVATSRAQIRGAIHLLNSELQQRRGYTYNQEDARFVDSLRERMEDTAAHLRELHADGTVAVQVETGE